MLEDNRGLDRRAFLKGAALAGAGALAGGALAGCAPNTPTTPTVTNKNDSPVVSGGTSTNPWVSQAAASWRVQPDPVDESLIADGGTYDVVVLGGGQSGTWTARAASRDGASVAVVEIGSADNGMHYIGGECASVNSQWALSKGIPRIDEVEFLQEVYRRNAGRSNTRTIHKFAYESGRLFDWAVADLNDPAFMEANTHIMGQDSDPELVFDPSGFKYFLGTTIFRAKDNPAPVPWMWSTMMIHHREAAIASGTNWLWEHSAQYLEKDGSGRVVSVIVKNVADESYIRLTAKKGIVIALGDFNGNPEMLFDINDEYRWLAESVGMLEELTAAGGMAMGVRNGDGIKLGVWAGGHVEVGPHAGMNTGMIEGSPWGPGFLLLNQKGKRFCDEIAGGAEGSGYLVPRQPKGYVVSFADANWKNIVKKIPPCHGAIDYTHGVANKGIDAVEATMAALTPGGAQPNDAGVYTANTLEELVEMVGVWNSEQKATAMAELKRFNELAAAGKDTDFGYDHRLLQGLTTPPFHAVKYETTGFSAGLCQTTGLDTDGDHQVLDSNLEPIPGLYAAGNSSGNRYIVQYSSPMAGMSLGYCLTEGLLLGEMLAKM